MAYHVNFSQVFPHIPEFLKGLGVGLYLAVISLFLGMILGIIIAFFAVSKNKFLRGIAHVYVDVLRNLPLLVIIFICYFGLPDIGIILDKNPSFIFALTLYAAAYLSEVFRAGLQSIPKGTIEAGMAIGLKRIQILAHIQLPIMFRNVMPSLSNTFISLFKDTSLASSITVVELTYLARKVNTATFRVIEVWLIVGIMYVVACYLIATILRQAERKLKIK